MARIKGMGEAFASFASGGLVSLGPVNWTLEAGEYIVPKDVTLYYIGGLASASGCFTSTFSYQLPPAPGKDGWEPRVKWDR